MNLIQLVRKLQQFAKTHSDRTEFERAFDEHQVLNELKASSWENLSESCIEIPIGRKR